MSCNKMNAAKITPILAAGSTESPYYYQVNISQRLCTLVCVDETPIFNPTFSYVGISNVGTNEYVVTIHVEDTITYVPCNGNSCCSRVQYFSQNFTLPIYATAEPTSITIAKQSTVNSISVGGCEKCSRDFVSENAITVTVA